MKNPRNQESRMREQRCGAYGFAPPPCSWFAFSRIKRRCKNASLLRPLVTTFGGSHRGTEFFWVFGVKLRRQPGPYPIVYTISTRKPTMPTMRLLLSSLAVLGLVFHLRGEDKPNSTWSRIEKKTYDLTDGSKGV